MYAYHISRVDNVLEKHDRASVVRFHLNPEFRNKRGRGGARKILRSGRRVANGEKKIEFNRPEPRKEKQRRQQFYDLGAQLKEWRKRAGVYIRRKDEADANSIPLVGR